MRVLGGKECVGAGAFVHAVEDECAAVRAMAAMSERWAVEHLTDLLTDGVDARGLSTEQLHAALAMLEEPLGVARAAVQALLCNMARFGEDMGARCWPRCSSTWARLWTSCCSVDRRFEPVEAVADDALYVGCAVADDVLSAAGQCDQLVARLPRFLVVLHARFPVPSSPRALPDSASPQSSTISVPSFLARLLLLIIFIFIIIYKDKVLLLLMNGNIFIMKHQHHRQQQQKQEEEQGKEKNKAIRVGGADSGVCGPTRGKC